MQKGSDFIALLADRYITGDGANGSRLFELGCQLEHGAEINNLRNPDIVRRIHTEYIDAGAELIETNTFAANAIRLESHGLNVKCEAINQAGVTLALEAAGAHGFVSGSVGPTGLNAAEKPDLIRDAFKEQISVLCEAGIHLIHLETFADLAEIQLALEAARAIAGDSIPIIAQMVFSDAGTVTSGEDGRTIARALIDGGASVIGANCGRGISVAFAALKKLVPASGSVPVSVYVNAGFPENVDGRLVYRATPAYIAQNAVRFAKMGARIIGGCCGTTPETVRAVADALTTVKQARVVIDSAQAELSAEEGPAAFKQGAWLDNLGDNRLPVIAELDPPGHLQYEATINHMKAFAASGADAVSMAENPLASLKISNLAMACIVQSQVNIPAICHITCRDRNVLGLQSALMGAHIQGIRSILAISGDPVPQHSAGLGQSVFNINSVGLVRLLAGLNRGRTSNGRDLKEETDFSIGVGFNSAARNMDGEIDRYERKLAEGARYIMTQPVFDADHGRRVLEMTRRERIRIFLGFFPLTSARSALYLHNEVPGVTIPDEVLHAITAYESAEDQKKAGIEMLQKLLQELMDDMDGVYLISPHRHPEVLTGLIKTVVSAR